MLVPERRLKRALTAAIVGLALGITCEVGAGTFAIGPTEHAAESNASVGCHVHAVKADPWRGRRVAIRTWVATDHAEATRVWLRFGSPVGGASVDAMDKRPMLGVAGQWLFEAVVDVPPDAAFVVCGVYVVGDGTAHIDAVQFEGVPRTVDESKQIDKKGQLHPPKDVVYQPPSVVLELPTNLGFEVTPP